MHGTALDFTSATKSYLIVMETLHVLWLGCMDKSIVVSPSKPCLCCNGRGVIMSVMVVWS